MGGLSREEAAGKIRAAGLRATLPRIAVYRALSRATKPLSHGELVAALGEDMLDQATVYRNLVKLVGVDLARVASRMSGVARYELQDSDEEHLHPHFACRSCGTVECLPQARLVADISNRWKESLSTSELQLLGECPDCLNKEGSAQALAPKAK